MGTPRPCATFDDALDALEEGIRDGTPFSQLDDWIEELPLGREEKAVLWFVLHGKPRRRRRVIFTEDLAELVG